MCVKMWRHGEETKTQMYHKRGRGRPSQPPEVNGDFLEIFVIKKIAILMLFVSHFARF